MDVYSICPFKAYVSSIYSSPITVAVLSLGRRIVIGTFNICVSTIEVLPSIAFAADVGPDPAWQLFSHRPIISQLITHHCVLR